MPCKLGWCVGGRLGCAELLRCCCWGRGQFWPPRGRFRPPRPRCPPRTSSWSSSVSWRRTASGRRQRNSIANRRVLSSPGCTSSNISVSSSDGGCSPSSSAEKRRSAFWKDVSWWAASRAVFNSSCPQERRGCGRPAWRKLPEELP